jgi:hypothetical protein
MGATFAFRRLGEEHGSVARRERRCAMLHCKHPDQPLDLLPSFHLAHYWLSRPLRGNFSGSTMSKWCGRTADPPGHCQRRLDCVQNRQVNHAHRERGGFRHAILHARSAMAQRDATAPPRLFSSAASISILPSQRRPLFHSRCPLKLPTACYHLNSAIRARAIPL